MCLLKNLGCLGGALDGVGFPALLAVPKVPERWSNSSEGTTPCCWISGGPARLTGSRRTIFRSETIAAPEHIRQAGGGPFDDSAVPAPAGLLLGGCESTVSAMLHACVLPHQPSHTDWAPVIGVRFRTGRHTDVRTLKYPPTPFSWVGVPRPGLSTPIGACEVRLGSAFGGPEWGA